MPLKSHCNLTFLFLICCCQGAFAQPGRIPREEAKLARLYSALLSNSENSDSAVYYSEKFRKEITAFITATPATLDYPFKQLKDSNYCYITTAPDGNFRIYSWDTWTGGTMHFFNQVIQYRTPTGVFTTVPAYEVGDPGTYCPGVHVVTINNKVYYLPILNSISSTKDAAESIAAWTIRDNKLVDTVRIFQIKSGKLLNSIRVDYDFFSVVDRPERPIMLIQYDDQQKELRIPVVVDKGRVTKRYLCYKLQGEYFTFTGVAP